MENLGHGSLVDTVFSWTLNDVFNKKLFKHKVSFSLCSIFQ